MSEKGVFLMTLAYFGSITTKVMFHLFYASQLAKKDILDYITDQIKGDLGSALRAIGKVAL